MLGPCPDTKGKDSNQPVVHRNVASVPILETYSKRFKQKAIGLCSSFITQAAKQCTVVVAVSCN